MPTRREFIGKSAACASAALAGASSLSNAAAQDQQNPPGIKCLDYGASFICGTKSFNQVRFWVESRTTITDIESGKSIDYYQCASCKSENTFAEKDLFHAENYDFLPILGDGQWLVFRRPSGISPNYRNIKAVEDMWGVPVMKLREAATVTVLDTWEKIRDASNAGLPLVTQTTITNEETGLRAVIECPTKTMNISLDKEMYQVDTGPIAYPDLTKKYDPQIDCIKLAFIALNAPHFADFVVEQPTPVLDEDGNVKGEVYHYSMPFSVPAQNVVLALGSL